MIQLIYSSSALKVMTQDDLVAILQKARSNNEKLNVTGMLLYHDGNFMQVLEGEEAVVKQLFETISKDERHHDIHTILTREIQDREFKEWEMAFLEIQDKDFASIEGYNQILKDKSLNSSYFRDHPTYAGAFMQAFMNSVR